MNLVFGRDLEGSLGIERREVGVVVGSVGGVAHLAQLHDDLVARELKTGARVDVGGAGDEGAGGEGRRENGAGSAGASLLVDDVDRLNAATGSEVSESLVQRVLAGSHERL